MIDRNHSVFNPYIAPSKREDQSIALSFLLVIIAVIATLLENSISVLIFSGLWYLAGVLLIKFCFPTQRFPPSLKYYTILFVLYYVYMVVTNYAYVNDPYNDFFYKIDSTKFYEVPNSIILRDNSEFAYQKVWAQSGDWKGFGIISWFTGKIAYYIDENSIVIQKLQAVFAASMIVTFLYNISCLYFDKIKARNIALSFGLFTHLFTFSAVFSRDIHVGLLFICGFYILLSRKRFRNLAILMLLCLITSIFRTVNGIFYLSFIGFYLLLYFQRGRLVRNSLISWLSGLVILASFVAFSLTDAYGILTDEVSHYNEYHTEKLMEAQGLGAYLTKLPQGGMQAARIVISQINPFPFYTGVHVGIIDSYQYWLIPLCIASIYWICVWGFLVIGLWKKHIRAAMDANLKASLIIAFMLIIGAGATSPEFRRLMCVYPILYLGAAHAFYMLPSRKRQVLKIRLLGLYAMLVISYLALKFL